MELLLAIAVENECWGGPRWAAFLALFDVPAEVPQWQSLDPLQRRQRTLDAVKRLLLRESQVQPLLLVFEDLHWIDGETQLLLDSLIESLPASRLLLLANYRPEYNHSWGSKTYYRQVRLDTLQPGSSSELLQVLLGDDPALESLKEGLIIRTGGNPLFLEESVAMLVETKFLKGDRGGYHLAKEAQMIQVPATVQAILSARIDRLPPEEKRILQSASVIGKDVPFQLLNEIAEKHDEELRRNLAHLQAAEFLYETNLFPELEYTFKHALTLEVAYGSILNERRIAIHTAIVEAIERLYPDRLNEQVERLALHSFRGGAWAKASQYLREAGAKAEWRSANQEAAGYFEQALSALKHLPENRETVERGIDIRLDLRSALFPLAELGRGYEILLEAEALARNLGDQRRLTYLLAQLAHHFWSVGDFDRGVEIGNQALSLAMELKDFALQVAANHFLGQIHHARGDFRQAVYCTKWIVNMLDEELSRKPLGMRAPPAILARTWLTWSLAEVGSFSEGILRAEEGLRIAEGIDHLYSLFHAYWGIGISLLRKGDFLRAITFLERSRSIAQIGHLPFMHNFTSVFLGLAYGLVGRAEEAIEILEQTAKQTSLLGLMFLNTISMAHLGEVYLLANRVAEAKEASNRAIQLCRQYKTRGYEAWSLRLVGEISTHSQAFDSGKAENYFRQAMEMAEEIGIRPLVAHCYFGLGRMFRRIEKLEDAKEHLIKATTMFQEMNMGYWLEKAEAVTK